MRLSMGTVLLAAFVAGWIGGMVYVNMMINIRSDQLRQDFVEQSQRSLEEWRDSLRQAPDS